MTEKRQISILLMDDEIDSPVIQAAIQHLNNQGFDVDIAHTMSEAIEAYYQHYYDVFILDIDMSMMTDDQEGDGINVLKRFISLHNQTRVIMYSAAGKSPHWVAATNAHCFAYVHKGEKDALQRLSDFVHSSLIPETLPAAEAPPFPAGVLLFAGNEPLKSTAESVIEATLGTDWRIQAVKSLADAEQAVNEPNDFGVIVILQPFFKMRAEERQLMEKLLSKSPSPQVIVGCEARDEYQSAILYLANHHPFRLLDISKDDWRTALEQSLKAARTWYGRREIFQADPNALRRLNINLPDDILEDWAGDDMDELYEDFYEDMKNEGDPT
jgi:CheY-like chemotaxis protein